MHDSQCHLYFTRLRHSTVDRCFFAICLDSGSIAKVISYERDFLNLYFGAM